MFKIKNLKNNRSLQWLLAIILLILFTCYLPSLLFFPLCLKENIFRPPNTEVLISACKQPVAVGVPGGEVLFVQEKRTGRVYLLDLRTGEKRNVPNDPLLLDKGVFLSSELVWLEGSLVGPDNPNYRPHYILDLADGKRYELLDLNLLPRLEHGKFDPSNYVYIQSAQDVFIHHSKNTLIALSSDFRTNPMGRIVFSGYAISDQHGELTEKLLRDLSVSYEVVDFSLRYTNVTSPTNKYVVHSDAIFLSGTETPIINREYTGGRYMGGYYEIGYFRGWYYDESGVVVQENSSYLFSSTLGPQFFLIPRPILKLQLPATP